MLDEDLIITSANRAFYQTFRTSRSDTEGCLIYDLGNRQWDIPALRTLLESVIPHRASVEGFEVEHDFPFLTVFPVVGSVVEGSERIFLLAAKQADCLAPDVCIPKACTPGGGCC